ncbi:MAG: DUF3592 domain-containing protein [Thioalkalivibrio sp.]|nr:DUF3592 domain-containing protein [Thioalkalivibrio sp.]
MLHCFSAIILVGVGLTTILVPIMFSFSWWRMRHWPRIPARIVSLSIDSRRNPVGAGVVVDEYRPSAEYEYQVKGRRYVGKRISLRDSRLWTDCRKDAEFGSFASGSEVMVGVSPSDPSKSIIDTNVSLRDLVFLGVLIVLGILISCTGAWVATLICF